MTERTLTKEEIERLKLHGIEYPWSPFQSLVLIDRISKTIDVLFDVETREHLTSAALVEAIAILTGQKE